jgi:hypothetical protein
MRTLFLLWVGGNAAVVGYFVVRSALLRKRMRYLYELMIERDWGEAIQEDRVRRWARANARLMTDMWVKDVEAEVCDMGVFIPLANPHDVAEFISASPIFTTRAA